MSEEMTLKGYVNLLLLRSVQDLPTHGQAIVEDLRRKSRGEFDFDDAVVYTGLHRLESQGLVVSHWTEVDGRRCRVYRPTEKGRKALTEQRSQWKRFVQAMKTILD